MTDMNRHPAIGLAFLSRRKERPKASLLAACGLSILLMAPLSPSISRAAEADRPLKIATFGTSLTANGGWQEPLRQALAACLSRPVTVTNRAKVGETSAWGLRHLDPVIADTPDIVLIEFAANDAAVNRWMSRRESRDTMRVILRRLKAERPGVEIYVQAMNPFFGLRGWVRPFVDAYQQDHARLAAEEGAHFVDYRPIWGRMSAASLQAAIPDGLHPLPEAAISVIVPHLSGILCSAAK